MGRTVEIQTDQTEIHVDMMMTALQDILKRGSSDEDKEQEQDPQDEYLSEALQAVLGILAKYQIATEAQLGGSHPQEIEYDMAQLTAWAPPISIAGIKARTAVKYLQGRGRRESSQAVLQEKGRLEGKQQKFVAAHGEYLKNKIKGAYEMKAARAEMEADCLAEVVSNADSLCQVLKRVHDRQMREYIMSH